MVFDKVGMFKFSRGHINKWHLRKGKKKELKCTCRRKSYCPSYTAEKGSVLLSRAILLHYSKQNSPKVNEKLQLHGRPKMHSLSKRLSRHGLWLYLENAAVRGLRFPRNRTAFVSHPSTGITGTGVPNAEETRAKPLTDVGSGQCCYHRIKSPMYKIKPLRIATRSHSIFFTNIHSNLSSVIHFYPTKSFCLPYLQHAICEKFFSNKTVKYSQ